MSPGTFPDPSLSRHLATESTSPRLLHALHDQNSSVLSLSSDARHIYSGSQLQDIFVWCKETYRLVNRLKGHTGSILCLEYAAEKKWLFSSSGDSTVRIWCTKTLKPLYTINPYLDTNAGDLFSLSWSTSLRTVFIGCQNTSLQWLDLSKQPATALDSESNTGPPTPSRKVHKFFDSYPQYERKPADIYAKNSLSRLTEALTCIESRGDSGTIPVSGEILHIPATNVIDSAHYGYIYCMALIPPSRESLDQSHLSHAARDVQLVTGSGDETVKLWECTTHGPSILHTFQCSHGAVLSIVVQGNETIFAGCQDGYVKIWDLETKTLVRTLIVQEDVDILSLSLIQSDLYTCSANGQVQRWSASFDCTASWLAHTGGTVLSSLIDHGRLDELLLITGGSDGQIKLWEFEPPQLRNTTSQGIVEEPASDSLVHALSKFVSIPSISSDPRHREDCRQTAIWLKNCLGQLGAQVTLLPTGESVNPLVLATFSGTQDEHHRPRLLFYGHYDVVAAPPTDWVSDPFALSGRNGYLYGRGMTDDKGPIMAVAYATAELLSKRALGLDLVFLIEGEEEVGSMGFVAAVRKYKNFVGHIDAILVSNSTWITEDHPCLTYGLRGVIHCSVEISSGLSDMHSGIEGGAVVEPMMDMVMLLSSLADHQRHVKIPGFYDQVQQQPRAEKELFQRIAQITGRPVSSMSSRWREPSLTIHTVQMSGPQNSTVIPSTVKSHISIRIVPDQDLETITKSLCDYLKSSFQTLMSPNKLQIRIDHAADWWLGNLDDQWFKTLESAVREEWAIDPLRIREGGSIPSVPFLEKEFGCHALHLPLGQSSDQAHLPNERISLENLHRGKMAIERFLMKVADMSLTSENTES